MGILSNFDEILSDLIFDKKITVERFAKDIDITLSETYRYLRKESVPKLSTVIKIADRYNLSVDYILGLIPYPEGANFTKTPPFNDRFKELLISNSLSRYRLSKYTEIGINRIDDWFYGKCLPSAEHALKLSEYFRMSIDYLLGREK